MRAFEKAVEEFLEGYLAFHPTQATALGFHAYDAHLEDRSSEAIAEEVRRLESFRERLRREIAPDELAPDARLDWQILQAEIEAQLLHWNTIRWWARDPSYYSDLACLSVYMLVSRPTTPLERRCDALVQRLRQIPRLLGQAQEHLERTARVSGIPRVYLEIAREEFAGACAFFETAVSDFAASLAEAQKARALQEAARDAFHACQEIRRFLNEEVHGDGDFALGRETFAQLLAYEELITTPLDHILERGWRELRAAQRQMHEVARQISPTTPLPDLLRRLSEEHPTAEDLIPSYRRRCEEVKRFVRERDLVTLPEEDGLEIVETPSFSRSLIFAALDPPGAFETGTHPTFFYVTPVNADSSPEQQEEYLRAHNHYAQIATIIHEAYPGHHVQSLHRKRCPSIVRKIFSAGTFVEGWAHYCEQMVVEEGFGEGDPTLRLFQLHEALWRIGRLIAATLMHLGALSLERAIEFLVRECYQEPENARREVWRYTRDPLILVYSWGKWQILDVREEYRRRRGSLFSLKEFHDRLLGYGEPPMSALAPRLLSEAV